MSECTGTAPATPEPDKDSETDAPAPKPEKKSNIGVILVIFALAGAAGAAYYYIKFVKDRKPKDEDKMCIRDSQYPAQMKLRYAKQLRKEETGNGICSGPEGS